jgi:hypothetical protein
VSRENKESSKQPAVSENTLLNISRSNTVLDEHGLIWGNFMRAFPFNLWGVFSILRWIGVIFV